MTKTFWLSFCDAARPAGQQFLGVAVVDVDDDDIEEIRPFIAQAFPHAREDAEWVGAATRKAHLMGCNPGGEVASMELPREWPAFDTFPRNRLIQKTELKTLDT